MKRHPAVERAISVVGSQASLARSLGVQPPTVQQWLDLIRPVPVHRCVQIELLTAGAVSRMDLRPADWIKYWPDAEQAA